MKKEVYESAVGFECVAPTDWDEMESHVHEIVSSLFRRPFKAENVSEKAVLLYRNKDGTPGIAILDKSRIQLP